MDKYLSILHRYWGYPDFRGIQRDIIESIGAGHDTLGLMPTGGGKSLTFQVPALAEEGVCIVVTPLIALMRDQVDHLRQRGIQAAAIYSGMSRQDILTRLDNCVLGGCKLLYVSPERLSSETFVQKLRHMRVSFIAVDEAHCISQWGYDFRPSYLRIAQLRDLVTGVPVLALTATATPRVVDDIQQRLRFGDDGRVFRMSFRRSNLAYVVRHTEDKESELLHILAGVRGSAIVYTRSRKRTAEICRRLEGEGVSATFYHAGLEPKVKDERQTAWQQGQKRVIVATNAFGMGIDKPDVRLVVHYDPPSSLEEYFQEAGRAGRDGRKAYAVMLYTADTRNIMKARVGQTFPKVEEVRQVYEHLAFYYQIGMGSGAGAAYKFDIDRFSVTFHHFPVQVNSALTLLSRAGYIDYDPNPDMPSRIMFLLRRDELNRVEGLTARQTEAITALMRCYGGLFTDYVLIQEGHVAQEAGMSEDELYEVLKGLARQHIISYIPRSNTPYIRYAINRVETDQVELPPDVYDNRRADFEQRIMAVIGYAETDDCCRSEMLLRYFGEEQKEPCGMCDYCVSQRLMAAADKAKPQLLALTADGKPHTMKEAYALGLPMGAADEALRQLLAEEKLRVEGDTIIRNE